MVSKPLFLSVATPQQIKYALQNYRKSDGGKAASVSCLISGDDGESVPIALFNGGSFGYVLDETKVDCPHAEFYAQDTMGNVPGYTNFGGGVKDDWGYSHLKQYDVSDFQIANAQDERSHVVIGKEGGKKLLYSSKYLNKPFAVRGVGRFEPLTVTNHALWDSAEKFQAPDGPSLETFAKNVSYRYQKEPKHHKPLERNSKESADHESLVGKHGGEDVYDGEKFYGYKTEKWKQRYGGQGVMGYNEALVFQKEGAGNPIKGVFISLTKFGAMREADRKAALGILKENPHLKLYLYNRRKAKDGHIVKVCNYDQAIEICNDGIGVGKRFQWSSLEDLASEVSAVGAEAAPTATIGDRMSQFIKQDECQEFFAAFEKLDLQKQKDLFEFVWGSKRQLDSISELSSSYDVLKRSFVMDGSSNQEKQIFNDEMRNKMLQVMAQQEGRQEFVANYQRALGDYGGTFFDDMKQYDVVKKEMLAFIERDEMPQRVLISDYTASISYDPESLIEALQYAWNVGGDDKFNFEDLKTSCGISGDSAVDVKIEFNNAVRGGLVSRIEQIMPGFKKEYDDLMLPLTSGSKSYENVVKDVRRLLVDKKKDLMDVVAAAEDVSASGGGAVNGAAVEAVEAVAVVDDSPVEPGGYEFMIATETLDKVRGYKGSLESAAGDPKIGVYLAFNILKHNGQLPPGIDEDYFRYTGSTDERSGALGIEFRRQAQDLVSSMSTEEFLELLIQTKKPKFFAESAIAADAKLDWNEDEISILGDVNCAVDVTIYDNGRHKLTNSSDVHNDPFAGSLLFSPGALLQGGGGKVDIVEVVEGVNLSQEKLNSLYERRLLPLLLHANQDAEKNGRKAFVTIPGMGCGCFAGKYGKKIKLQFKVAIKKVIENHQDKLTNVAGVYLDLYDSVGLNEEKTLGATKFISRALMTEDGSGRPQLCHPSQYGDEFKDSKLYSVVAWDHVSWPGNDYYPGSRATDDGVKAAATDSMMKFTGVPGQYVANPDFIGSTNGYESANGDSWLQCIKERQVDLKVKGNVAVLEGEDLKRLKGGDVIDRDIVAAPAVVAVSSVVDDDLPLRRAPVEGGAFFTEPAVGEGLGQKLQKIRERFSRVGYYKDEADGSNNYFVRFSSKSEAEKFSKKLSESYGIVGVSGSGKVVVPTKSNGAPVYDKGSKYDYKSDQVKEYAIILTDVNYETFKAKEKEISDKSDELGATLKPLAIGAVVTDKFFFGSEENYRIGFEEVRRASSFAQRISESGIRSALGEQKSVIIDFFDGDRQVRAHLDANGNLQVSGEDVSYDIDNGLVYRDGSDQAIEISSSHIIFNESNRELLQAEVAKAQLVEVVQLEEKAQQRAAAVEARQAEIAARDKQKEEEERAEAKIKARSVEVKAQLAKAQQRASAPKARHATKVESIRPPSPSPSTKEVENVRAQQQLITEVEKYLAKDKSASEEVSLILEANLTEQNDKPKPAQAYRGCGIKASFDDRERFMIDEVFAAAMTRFTFQESDQTKILNNTWFTEDPKKEITAISVAGEFKSPIQIINEEMQRYPTDQQAAIDAGLAIIADAFHGKEETKFKVKGKGGVEVEISCAAKEKDVFVTRDCQSARLKIVGETGDKYNPGTHSTQAIDPNERALKVIQSEMERQQAR